MVTPRDTTIRVGDRLTLKMQTYGGNVMISQITHGPNILAPGGASLECCATAGWVGTWEYQATAVGETRLEFTDGHARSEVTVRVLAAAQAR